MASMYEFARYFPESARQAAARLEYQPEWENANHMGNGPAPRHRVRRPNDDGYALVCPLGALMNAVMGGSWDEPAPVQIVRYFNDLVSAEKPLPPGVNLPEGAVFENSPFHLSLIRFVEDWDYGRVKDLAEALGVK